MVKIKYIFIAHLILLNVNDGFSQIDNDTIIYWTKHTKLKWNDFQGLVPDSALSKDDMARINYGYPIFFESCYNNKVIVYFDKIRSWTKDTISGDILEHEQGHFDIVEIFARKIRKYFHAYCEGDFEQIDKAQIDNFIAQSDAFQDKYDNETKYGTNKIMQKRWNEIIRKELEKLKDYEVNYLEYINE